MKNVRFLDDFIFKRRDVGLAVFKIFLKYFKKIGLKNLCVVEFFFLVKLGFEEVGCK